MAAITPGATIDGFTIGALAFTGGAAWLYSVTHPAHPGSLLMKVPRIGVDQPTESLIGFETECMILPAIQGVHAPRFIAAGPIDEIPYLVMEWVAGFSLGQYAKRGTVEPERVA